MKGMDINMDTIVVENVVKVFKNQEVLKNVSMSCKEGEICGIIGHNGSGKSVLFKCICGFFKTDCGEIHVRGKKAGRDFDILSEAGIIIEGPAYLGYLSGIDNLEFLYGIRNRKDMEHLHTIMNLVGLDGKSRKRVSKYSMGMKQRLSIAQAIMENHDILILDEPMNGLDKKGCDDIRALLLDLKRKGKTILMSSHNKGDIDILCDRVYEMDNGVLSNIEL